MEINTNIAGGNERVLMNGEGLITYLHKGASL